MSTLITKWSKNKKDACSLSNINLKCLILHLVAGVDKVRFVTCMERLQIRMQFQLSQLQRINPNSTLEFNLVGWCKWEKNFIMMLKMMQNPKCDTPESAINSLLLASFIAAILCWVLILMQFVCSHFVRFYTYANDKREWW